MLMGEQLDPHQQSVPVNLPQAKEIIDLLSVLEEKTKGNLSDDESKELKQLLGELRSRFVQVATMVAKQMSQGGPAGTPGTGLGVSGGAGADPLAAATTMRGPVGPIITE